MPALGEQVDRGRVLRLCAGHHVGDEVGGSIGGAGGTLMFEVEAVAVGERQETGVAPVGDDRPEAG